MSMNTVVWIQMVTDVRVVAMVIDVESDKDDDDIGFDSEDWTVVSRGLRW